MYLMADVSVEDRRHADDCPECQARIANLAASLTDFRGAVRTWSDGAFGS